MKRGKFIALEGGEGTGKSTQSRLLVDALSAQGISAEATREPGGTEGAEAIRSLLLSPPGDGWGPRAEALLFAAARADHVEKRIRPALTEGRWIVCDRFVDSSRAYQGGAGELGDGAITELHAFGSEGLRPDLTLVIDVPAELREQRLALRDAGGSDAIGGRTSDYHAAVRESFVTNAASDSSSIVIDGEGTPGDVHDRIMAAVRPLMVNE
ncbi:dTMP kinase [Erythrobacteraceae bacterium WH01K]|nr:dTMP kinase [Erythrobacteraceae bacterium WH01K]